MEPIFSPTVPTSPYHLIAQNYKGQPEIHLVVSSIFPFEYPNLGKHTFTYVSDFHIPLLGLIPSCSEIQFISICKLTAIMQITSGYDLHSFVTHTA